MENTKGNSVTITLKPDKNNKMAIFAKLWDIDPTHQVLARLEDDSEDPRTYLVLSTDIEGVQVEAKVGFKTVEAAQKAFDNYQTADAFQFFKQVKEQFI